MANPMLSVMCALHTKSTCAATGDTCSLSERVDAPIRIELLVRSTGRLGTRSKDS